MTARDIVALYRATDAEARDQCAERVALVRQYDDLAKRLTLPPVGFDRPEQWNGYLPPRMTAVSGGFTYNDSHQRVHLVAIVREAVTRTHGEEMARKWLAQINTDQWSGHWTPHTAIEGN
jgi:hypothetical protein